MKFSIGDRVIKSELALEHHICPRQSRNRIGVIVGRSKMFDCVRVRWEGTKSGMTIHDSYIEAMKKKEEI